MHPRDDEIQALIDGELETPRSSRLRAHLKGCETCRERHAALEARWKGAAELLDLLAVATLGTTVEDIVRAAEARPSSRETAGGRTLLKAASFAGLLVAGAVVAAVVPGPFREAVDRILRGPAVEEASPPPAVTDPWRQEAGVALVPGGALEVAFESRQAQGTLELVVAGGDTARVEVRSDSVGFVVGEGSVLVQNRGTRASYRIVVPSDLPTVRILIGSRVIYEVADGQVVRDEFDRAGAARQAPLSGIR